MEERSKYGAGGSGCEYNPDEHRAVYGHEDHYHEAPAVWIVGAKGQWRLCDSCAKLPEFRRYRKRQQILRKARR